MEQKTISLDSDSATKLKRISEASHISQTEILREFLDACVTVLESLDTERISFGSVADTKRRVVLTGLFPLFVGTLPSSTLDENIDSEIKKKIEKASEKK